MKNVTIILIALFVFSLVFLTRSFSQEEKEPQKLSLKPAIEKAIQDLASPMIMEREEAAQTLIKLGDKAVPYLEKAVKSKNPLLSRRAKWVLMEIKENQGKGLPEKEHLFPPGLNPDLGGPFSAFPRRFFSSDFEDLEGYLESLRKQINDQLKSLEDQKNRISTQKSSVTMAVEKDGRKITYHEDEKGAVKVTIVEEKKGQKETRTYSAESRDEFKAKYPEIFKELEQSGISFNPVFPDDWFAPFPSLKDWTERGLIPWGGAGKGNFLKKPLDLKKFGEEKKEEESAGEGQEKGRLGVYIQNLQEFERKHLGLGEAEGLLITEVVPGSLAEALGVENHDILLKVKGKAVKGPEDVKKALLSEGPVNVEILRKGERKVLTLKPR